jgi:hypothetical protein
MNVLNNLLCKEIIYSENNNLNISSFLFANSKTMKPILFSIVVSLLFFAGCKKEELNNNSDTEKQKIYFLKEGNTWVYKNKFPIRTYTSDGFIYDTLTAFDTMYVSRKILKNDGRELFEIKLKRSSVYNGIISYDESILGEYANINDFVYNSNGYNNIWRGIQIKNEANKPGKKSGGGCDFHIYEIPVVADSIKFDFFDKSIDAYLSIYETYCEDNRIFPVERTSYYYADGIGLLKIIRNPKTWEGYTSKELIYFSELQ